MKYLYAFGFLMFANNALAHGGHVEMAETIHSAHHGLETLGYMVLGLGLVFGATLLVKKRGGRP